MNLPIEPGLQRRLAYSEYIRTRSTRQRRRTNYTFNNNDFIISNNNDFIISGFNIYGLKLKDLIKKSRVYIIKNSKFECSICLYQEDESESDYVIRRLNCNHEFHIHCIERWLSKETTCPICRKDLSI